MPAIENRPSSTIGDLLTLAHVTHEAVEHIGGIGTVLEGMMTSPVYQAAVGRSILVGPLWGAENKRPEDLLGPHGTVHYAGRGGIDTAGLGLKLRPVEWAFNVGIVYGTRTYAPPGQGRTGQSEVLLIDVRGDFDAKRLATFKLRLWERFGIDSARYDAAWDYEEYVRLAEPATYALRALLRDDELPCVLFAHEFMGMPAALSAILENESVQHGNDTAEGDTDGRRKNNPADPTDRPFRTVFHAHECATARDLVEHHPGHDTMFYNVLDQARAAGQFVEDVFPGRDEKLRHALISRSHHCDGIAAVGDRTADELHFLNAELDAHTIDLVYNGIPAHHVSPAQKKRSRAMLLDYAETLYGDVLGRPDVLLTHVTRPVVSKGMWRDVQVCERLDEHLAQANRTGVLFWLTSAGGVRSEDDIRAMEQSYGWPRHHRDGFPDLVGPELDLHALAEQFNAARRHLQIVLVNQFGWSPQRIGTRLPAGMHMDDFRHATDAEFGMATYEPFGISPLEPLGAGAVCVISNVCGCAGFVEQITAGKPTDNVLVADYTRLPAPMTPDELLAMTAQQRGEVEAAESRCVADELFRRLPTTDTQRDALLATGQQLADRMGWDSVLAQTLLPMLGRIR